MQLSSRQEFLKFSCRAMIKLILLKPKPSPTYLYPNPASSYFSVIQGRDGMAGTRTVPGRWINNWKWQGEHHCSWNSVNTEDSGIGWGHMCTIKISHRVFPGLEVGREESLLHMYEELSLDPRTHVISWMWSCVYLELQHLGDKGMAGACWAPHLSSRISERPCFKRIRQRLVH